MSTTKDKLRPENITFAAACRENTGAHFLDSGGAYGRHHERPEISDKTPTIIWEDKEYPPSLLTSAYLDNIFEIDRKLQKKWSDWDDATKEELDWFASAAQFMDSMDMESVLRDNTYNQENDLTQDFVYSVYIPIGNASDEAIYAGEDVVTVLFIHCGCDVRGGYGRPLFCRGTGDYSIPTYPVVEFITESIDPELRSLGEKWQLGYSAHPWYQFNEDVEEYCDRPSFLDADQVRVTLKTGGEVIVRAVAPCQ